MNGGIRVGRVAGVDVVADLSVFGIAALVAWLVVVDLRVSLGPVSAGGTVPAVVVVVVGYLASLTAHELSHAVVARRRGLEVRGIHLFVFGGSTVVDPDAEHPADELAVAAAGPLMSLVAAAVFAGAAAVAAPWPTIGRAFELLAVMNLAIGVVNLLPGFPLDGGRVLRSFLWARSGDRARATDLAIRFGRILGLMLVGAGVYTLIAGRLPVGALGALVGWFLTRSADAAGRRERLLARVDGLTALDVMRPVSASVPGSMTVARMLDLYGVGPRLRSLPVEVDGRAVGLVGEREVAGLPPDRRPTTSVASVMSEIGPADVVDPGMPLDELLGRPAGRTGRAVVVDDGEVVGIIEGPDLGEVFDGS